jgi:hypothetical protein
MMTPKKFSRKNCAGDEAGRITLALALVLFLLTLMVFENGISAQCP